MSTSQTPQPKPLWTLPDANGYEYASWGRISREEPSTILGLKQENGSRSQNSKYSYYVRLSKFNNTEWRISRKQIADVTSAPPVVAEQKTLVAPTKEEQIAAFHNENTELHKETITVNREMVKALNSLTDVLWELVRKQQ